MQTLGNLTEQGGYQADLRLRRVYSVPMCVLVRCVLLVVFNKHVITFEPRREKTCLRGSDQARNKPSCTATENSQRLEIAGLGSKGLYYLHVCSEKKGAVICVFVFAYMQKAGFLMTGSFLPHRMKTINAAFGSGEESD